MPNPSAPAPSTRSTLLRNAGFVVAVALGAVGIWLIVAGNSTQRVEIGVLTGLWGLLLGAICGRRVVLGETNPPPPQPQAGEPVTEAVREQTAIALREVVELERADVAAARRAFEAELASLLRQEVRAEVTTAVTTAINTVVPPAVDAAVSREVGQLRAEIQQLRQELLDKVGGQLRLERIETTRLIGSDLEAMRAEFRRLKQDEESAAVVADRPATSVNGTVIEAEPVEPVEPAPVPAAPPPQVPAAPAGADAGDPFASLPRLTPFVEESGDDGEDAPTAVNGREAAVTEETEEPGYSGRRRRAEHAEGGEDVLTQLLAREGTHR